MHERVLDQHARDLQHALLVAEHERAVAALERQAPPVRARSELVDHRLRDRIEIDRLAFDAQPPRIGAREVEQLRRELRQAIDLLAHRREELAAGRLVELLVAEQLEEAAEGEDRRAELVRGVRDELAPRVVERRQPLAHPVERARELTDLVRAVVDHRLVELPGRDPLGRGLEPPQAAREEQSAEIPDRERRDERERAGDQRAGRGRDRPSSATRAAAQRRASPSSTRERGSPPPRSAGRRGRSSRRRARRRSAACSAIGSRWTSAELKPCESPTTTRAVGGPTAS